MKIVDMETIKREGIERIPICKCGKQMQIECATLDDCRIVIDKEGCIVSVFPYCIKPAYVSFICECGEMVNYTRGDWE